MGNDPKPQSRTFHSYRCRDIARSVESVFHRRETNKKIMIVLRKVVAVAAFASLILVSLINISKPGIESGSMLTSGAAILLVALMMGRAAIWSRPTKAIWLPVLAGLVAIPFVIVSRAFGSFIVISLLFHAQFGISGADFAGFEREILEGALYVCMIIFAAMAMSNVLNDRVLIYVVAACLLVLFNPLTRYIYEFSGRQDIESDLHLQLERLELSANAARPDIIIVYLEGLERSYANTALFGDVYAPLQAYEGRGVSFSQVGQVFGTEWSLAGIVATQCGVPLIPNGFRYYAGMRDQADFMPGRRCLSDILGDLGYQSSFLIGSGLGFGGYDHFFAAHPVDQVIDSDVLAATRPAREIARADSGWVLDDQLIFDAARQEYDSRVTDAVPMLMTIETYGPHGSTAVVSRGCTSSGQAGLAPDVPTAIACTLKDMVSFLDHVARSRGDRSTVVLLMSDHLNHDPAMGARFNDDNRQNTVIMYGLGLDSPLVPAGTLIDKPGSMPDVFPTLLAFAGLADRDAMAGLGRSLFSTQPTIVEEKGIGRYNAELFPNPLLKAAIWDAAPK